jgi:hypothetical protein
MTVEWLQKIQRSVSKQGTADRREHVTLTVSQKLGVLKVQKLERGSGFLQDRIVNCL